MCHDKGNLYTCTLTWVTPTHVRVANINDDIGNHYTYTMTWVMPLHVPVAQINHDMGTLIHVPVVHFFILNYS